MTNTNSLVLLMMKMFQNKNGAHYCPETMGPSLFLAQNHAPTKVVEAVVDMDMEGESTVPVIANVIV